MAKTYPFSVEKHAHDFTLYFGHIQYGVVYAMDCGEIPFDQNRYDACQNFLLDPFVQKVDSKVRHSYSYPITYLTWEELKLARKIVAKAKEMRAMALIEAEREDLMEYI